MIKVLAVGTIFDLPELNIFLGLAKKGVKLDAVVSKNCPSVQKFNEHGIETIVIDFKSRVDPKAIFRLGKILRKGNYDIVHCLTARTASNGLLASLGLPIKRVTYRGTSQRDSWFSPASWLSFLNPGIHKIICVSDAVKEYLSKMIPQERLVTIHKGHDLSWYDPKPISLDQFGVPANAFIVACVANIRPVKGIDYLIESLKYIPTDSPVHLLLIGKGDKSDHDLNSDYVQGRLHFAGFQKDAVSILAKCQAFVMPSVAREGLPRAMMEALSLGIPTIVTNVGGMPEVVADGENGLVVPPRDSEAIAKAIMRIYKDKSLRDKLARNGRTTIADRFNIKDSIEKTYLVYREVLETKA